MGLPVDSISPDTGFTVNNLTEQHLELPFKSTGFRPEYFSFLFVKNGRGKYTTDDVSFDSEPGTIYFTNPGHFKSFEWYAVDDVTVITFTEGFLTKNVHPEIFKEFPFLLAETVRPKVLQSEAFTEFETLYKQIYKEHHSSSPYKYKIIGSFFVILLLKIKEYFWSDYNPIYEGQRSSQIVKSFKQLLEKHYRDLHSGKAETVFRVQDYAREQNLHPNYLSNVIKTKTGKPIVVWIADKTIAEAKSLLQNSSVSVKEISYKLGFSETAHFSNFFKKHIRISPAQYRKQNLL
jgi:AraC-like DNA-binding protein